MLSTYPVFLFPELFSLPLPFFLSPWYVICTLPIIAIFNNHQMYDFKLLARENIIDI